MLAEVRVSLEAPNLYRKLKHLAEEVGSITLLTSQMIAVGALMDTQTSRMMILLGAAMEHTITATVAALASETMIMIIAIVKPLIVAASKIRSGVVK